MNELSFNDDSRKGQQAGLLLPLSGFLKVEGWKGPIYKYLAAINTKPDGQYKMITDKCAQNKLDGQHKMMTDKSVHKINRMVNKK